MSTRVAVTGSVLGMLLGLWGCSKPVEEANEAEPAKAEPAKAEPAVANTAAAAETPKVAAAQPAAAPAGEPMTYLDVPEGSAFDTTVQNAATADLPTDDDETRIYKQVRQRLRLVNGCYARQRQIEPTLAGKLTLKVTVGPAPKGPVTTVEVAERTLKSPEVENCVLGTVKSFSFARSGETPLTVSLPLIFR